MTQHGSSSDQPSPTVRSGTNNVQLNHFDFQILLFINIRPREQASVSGLLPILQNLQNMGLVTTVDVPTMPDETLWTTTLAGVTLIKDWQKDGYNRHRQFGLSSTLPE